MKLNSYSFIQVSLSGVTTDYVPYTAFLALKEMPKNHTGEAIHAEYERVVEDWDIKSKVRTQSFTIFKPINAYIYVCTTFNIY